MQRLISNHRILTILKSLGLYGTARRIYHSSYRRRWSQFYSMFVKPNDLCFDIGANIGSRIGIFLDLGAHVVAVEPQSACFERLQQKYGSNPKVRLIHAGLDKSEGTRTIHLCENDALSSMSEDWIARVKTSGRFSTLHWDKVEVVRVITLDSLVVQFGIPAFCKIDVEGFELRVIQGLTRKLPCLSFEFSTEMRQKQIEIVRLLMNIGDYRFNYAIGEPTRLSLENWVEAKQIIPIVNATQSEGDIYAKC